MLIPSDKVPSHLRQYFEADEEAVIRVRGKNLHPC